MLRGSRIPIGRIGFLALKLANLALVTIYSFEIIYVLVRVVPPGFYPWMVFVASIGNYVLVADLGFSAYVYAAVRRDFLADDLDGADDLVSQAASLYLGIAVAVVAIAAVVMPAAAPAGMAAALTAYFATIVLPLPWMLIRRVAAALDHYIAIESVECIRRAVFCLVAATMLMGVSLLEFALACLALWMTAAAAAWWILSRNGFHLRWGSPRRIALFWRENRSGVVKSGRVAALDFFVDNFPYLAIPVIFHGPADLVSFDLFTKVARFGGAAYGVPGEVFTPPQTRAFYAGDANGVMRYQRWTWWLSALPLIVGGVLIGVFGGPVFERLLAGTHEVSPLVRLAMILMLVALLLRSAAAGFLTAVAKYDELAIVAAIAAALMVAVLAATAIGAIPFPVFMLLYVSVYFIHAVVCQWFFVRLRRAPPLARPPEAPARDTIAAPGGGRFREESFTLNRSEVPMNAPDSAISLVVPTRNRAYTLRKVLPSYFEQEGVCEIVLIDDAGTDDVAEVFAEIGRAYPQVERTYWRNERRGGASRGRQQGAMRARHPFVLFCDDDEYLEPGYAAECRRLLIENRAGAVSGRRVYMLPGETRMQALARFGNGLRHAAPFDYRLCEFVNGARFEGVLSLPLTNSNILTRKDLVARYGFDAHYSTGNGYREESDFQMNLFVHGLPVLVSNAVHSFHLPMREVRSGGQRVRRMRKFLWSVRYNSYFLDKYYGAYRNAVGLSQPLWLAKAYATAYFAWRNFLRPPLYAVAMRARR
ncbi:MAG: glycosyltransferase family 2 protein [Sphingomonas sp.]